MALRRAPSPGRPPVPCLPHTAHPGAGALSGLPLWLQESQEQELQRRLLDEQFAVLRGTAAEAERILQDAVAKLDDPLHLRCTSSPDYLVSRAQAALDAVSALEKGHAQYLVSRSDASALVAALTQFSYLAADTIVNGSATSHLAPTDPADRLVDTCRECGARALELLGQLQEQQTLHQAQPSLVRRPLQGILQLGQELKPKSLDVRQEELGAMVDKEMAATATAIEDAVRRIEDMMNQARHASSGVKLEVNERILNSCTDLMKVSVWPGPQAGLCAWESPPSPELCSGLGRPSGSW